MVKSILESGLQLQWSTWFREEPKIIEQWSKARSKKISQEQILGEGDYANTERQAIYDDHIMDLCQAAALNAQDRIRKIGKKIGSFTEGPKRPKGSVYRFLTMTDFSSK